jgi:broad specificity phosphatase PhoE
MSIVNLYWVRHAFSCANILEHKGPVANIMRPIVTIDPALTSAGVEQSKALNVELINGSIPNKFDIVLCSNLKRAMETAMFAFDNVNTLIYVVPYISEARNPYTFGIDSENAPLTADELEKYYLTIEDQFKIKVNFDLLKKLDNNGQMSPNYDNFIKIVLSQVLNKLENNTIYNVAVVSHSHFIKNHLINDLKFSPKMPAVQNTQIWMEQLELHMIKCIDNYKNINNTIKIYDGKPTPTQYEIENDNRCCNVQNNVLYSMAINNSTSCGVNTIPTSQNIKPELSVQIITWNMGSSVHKITNWETEIKKWNFNTLHDIIFITFQETTKTVGDELKNVLIKELNEYIIFAEGNGSILAPTFYVYGYLCIKKSPLIIINKAPIEDDSFDNTIDTTCIRKTGICTKPSIEFGIVVNNIKLIFICSHLPIITKNDPTLGYNERKEAMKTIYNNATKNVSKSIGGYDMIFWTGDMNYRVNADKTEQLHTLLNNLPNELPELVGFKEHPLNFKHTCRFIEYDDKQNYSKFVSNRQYDKKREPSNCDRIIFKGDIFTPTKYYDFVSILPEYPLSIAYSDHEPVALEGIIKIQSPKNDIKGEVNQEGGGIPKDYYYEKYKKYKFKYTQLKNE